MDIYKVEIRDQLEQDFAHECLELLQRYEVWRNDAGLLHRDNGPAVTATNPKSGNVTYRGWYAHGLMHKDDGPAMIYGEGDSVSQYQWMRHGKLHRESAPADVIQETLPTGSVNSIERWYKDGKLHRIGGPAYILRDLATGEIVEEVFCQNGQRILPDNAPAPSMG